MKFTYLHQLLNMSYMNKFKYSANNLNTLNSRNPCHMHAMKQTMMLYKANALYTFIPKNGCSTMRLSVGIANGCINSIDQVDWIHANNNTFNASLGEAIKADYSFIILRCPFRRLASVFLDKFVGKTPQAWRFHNAVDRNLELNDLTFRDFVNYLSKPAILKMDIHWQPQVDFLLYEKYSDYFSFENFPQITEVLKEKINLDVIDARSLTNHGLDKFSLIDNQCYADISAFDIAIMKRTGHAPSHLAMYDKTLYEVVAKLYAQDISLYSNQCDGKQLIQHKNFS